MKTDCLCQYIQDKIKTLNNSDKPNEVQVRLENREEQKAFVDLYSNFLHMASNEILAWITDHDHAHVTVFIQDGIRVRVLWDKCRLTAYGLQEFNSLVFTNDVVEY